MSTNHTAGPTIDLRSPLTAARDVRALLIERAELLDALRDIVSGFKRGYTATQMRAIASAAIAKAEQL
jgi:hypothetical protein